MAQQPFAGVLRELRDRLSQEKRTEAPGPRPAGDQRSETGRYPHKDTVRLLAETLEPAMPGT